MKTLLETQHLDGFYEDSQILHDINITIQEGESLSLIGRNGVGKTSFIKALMGIELRTKGQIYFNETNITQMPPEKRAALGMAYCPDDRGIFSTLSVFENLMLAHKESIKPKKLFLKEVEDLFPVLIKKSSLKGSHLSGGEQQMLAIARLLSTKAKLLILDEPTEGLAPLVVEKILDALKYLKKLGHALFIVEQNFHFSQKLSDRFVIMDEGKIIDNIKNTGENLSQERLRKALGLSAEKGTL